MFFKIGVRENFFEIFTGKNLRCSIFLINLFYLKTLLKQRFQHKSFPANIAKFLCTAFFIEHPRWLRLSYCPRILP